MSEICSITDCNREVFDNEKCILHYEKDDWFVVNENGKKDWSNSKDKIKEFWTVVYDLWGRGKSLEYVIFPPIDDSNELSNINDKSEQKTKKGILFEFDKLIKISNSTFLDDFKLDYKFKFYSILFEGTKFLGKLVINKVTIEIRLQFNYVIFDKRTDFILLNCKELEFYNSTFSEISYFCHLINLKKLEIANSPKIKKIVILNSDINSVYICNNKVFNEIEIVKTIINEYLKISNKRVNVLFFRECNFNAVTVKGKLSKQMYFDEYDIGSDFEINGCTFNDGSYIVIKKMNFNNFSIIDNDNISDAFCLHDIKIEKKIRFEYTNISNFEFHNCDISECYKIKIKNVAFQSNNGFTIFNGVKWCKINRINASRDTFRQLKYVNEKQGNIIEANKFYSAEMKAYKKELYKSRCYQRLQDKFIFCANMVVSNFSKNWILPIVWFFGSGFIAYSLNFIEKIILYISGDMQLTSLIIKKHLANYFVYINPFNTNPVGNSII